MTKAIKFSDALAAIRKRSGEPLPPDLEPARTKLQADVLASMGAADPEAALRAAIHAAAEAVVAKAKARINAALAPAAPPTPPPTMKAAAPTKATTTPETLTPGEAWVAIQTRAAARAGQKPGEMTQDALMRAVNEYLATPAGRALAAQCVPDGDAPTRATKGAAGAVEAFVQKGGDAYAQLETLAHARVAKSKSKSTFAKAFDEVLATSEGKRLYADYLREVDAVARQQTRDRQDPPR